MLLRSHTQDWPLNSIYARNTQGHAHGTVHTQHTHFGKGSGPSCLSTPQTCSQQENGKKNVSFLGHVGSVSSAFGLEFVFLLSLLRGGRTQPEPQGQRSHVTLPLGSWQGLLPCLCCLHKVQCVLQGWKRTPGSQCTMGWCQGIKGTGVLSGDGSSAVTTSCEVSASFILLQWTPGMASWRPGVFSQHGRARDNSRLQGCLAWGTRPVPWQEEVCLEIKYVKSCGTIMTGLTHLAQWEVDLHTHQCAQCLYTHITNAHPHTPLLQYTQTQMHSTYTPITHTDWHISLLMCRWIQSACACVHAHTNYLHAHRHTQSTYTPITHGHRLTPLLMCTYIHITHYHSCTYSHA